MLFIYLQYTPEPHNPSEQDLFHGCNNTVQTTGGKDPKYAVSISDTPVILKQSQGHQTINVDPKQDYNYTKMERSCFNGVREKASFKAFFPNQEMHQLSPLNMCNQQKSISQLERL